jgi:hypothetical protein
LKKDIWEKPLPIGMHGDEERNGSIKFEKFKPDLTKMNKSIPRRSGRIQAGSQYADTSMGQTEFEEDWQSDIN